MSKVYIDDITINNMPCDSRPIFSICAKVDMSEFPVRFSYDSVLEALSRGFNPIIFGKSLTVKKVIYNGPATIILWDDGTKTVVKCKEGDPYSPEAGFALAVLKRLCGDGFHKCLRQAMKGAVKDD